MREQAHAQSMALEAWAKARSESRFEVLEPWLGKTGDTGPLLGWLRKNVHRHGKRYRAAELMEKATGEKPCEGHFIGYVKDKYGPLYGIRL